MRRFAFLFLCCLLVLVMFATAGHATGVVAVRARIVTTFVPVVPVVPVQPVIQKVTQYGCNTQQDPANVIQKETVIQREVPQTVIQRETVIQEDVQQDYGCQAQLQSAYYAPAALVSGHSFYTAGVAHVASLHSRALIVQKQSARPRTDRSRSVQAVAQPRAQVIRQRTVIRGR